jgi:hypothetical protein
MAGARFSRLKCQLHVGLPSQLCLSIALKLLIDGEEAKLQKIYILHILILLSILCPFECLSISKSLSLATRSYSSSIS